VRVGVGTGVVVGGKADVVSGTVSDTDNVPCVTDTLADEDADSDEEVVNDSDELWVAVGSADIEYVLEALSLADGLDEQDVDCDVENDKLYDADWETEIELDAEAEPLTD
jgi:hypothetical protein